MKKFGMIALVVAVVSALSVGAFAYYRGNQGQGRQPGQMMMQQGGMGGRGGMMQQGGMGGRGMMSRNMGQDCTCGMNDGQQAPMMRGGRGQMNAPTTTEMITEDKAKAAAEEYLAKYLTGYTIEKIEKDEWRPMYFVTITGANDVKQMMAIHGYSGQVMHVFPAPAETPAATEQK
jgi:hypothetical protein